jgi:predicted GNAT superfamily acetyltransferase
MSPTLRLLDQIDDMFVVEALQRRVWGMEDVVPHHLLLTAAHNGGLILGAFDGEKMIGFVFGFPGLTQDSNGLTPKHCSHMLAVLPEYENQGIGFALKRAQWQMVRRQGISLITWTYDPLLSRNAHLNVARLGAVCSTYVPNMYGEMRDRFNQGLPSDRLQIDLWVNSPRVENRMSKRPRRQLDLAHYLSAGTGIINPTQLRGTGWPHPPDTPWQPPNASEAGSSDPETTQAALYLLEIPSDFQALKAADPELGLAWRLHVRALLQDLFTRGYLVTDFVFLRGEHPRSFYVLSHGDRTLGD